MKTIDETTKQGRNLIAHIRARYGRGEGVAEIHRSLVQAHTTLTYNQVHGIATGRTFKRYRRKPLIDLATDPEPAMKPYEPKARAPVGRRQGSAHGVQLTEEDVRAIRVMKECDASLSEIAKKIGCSRGTVHSVLSGRTWRHVQ